MVYPDTEQKVPISTYSPLQPADTGGIQVYQDKKSSGEKAKSKYERVLEFNQVKSPKKANFNSEFVIRQLDGGR